MRVKHRLDEESKIDEGWSQGGGRCLEERGASCVVRSKGTY